MASKLARSRFPSPSEVNFTVGHSGVREKVIRRKKTRKKTVKKTLKKKTRKKTRTAPIPLAIPLMITLTITLTTQKLPRDLELRQARSSVRVQFRRSERAHT